MAIKKKNIIDVPEPNKNIYGLISYIKKIDFKKEFHEIKEWLQLKPTTAAQMEDMLMDTSNYSNRADILIEHVKLERKKYDLECEDRLELLRSTAIIYLEDQKKKKIITKSITNQMIEDRILATHSSVYFSIQEKKNEFESIEKIVESLKEQIKNKEINIRKIYEHESYLKQRPAWANKNK